MVRPPDSQQLDKCLPVSVCTIPVEETKDVSGF